MLWDWSLCQGLNDRSNVKGVWPLGELITATQVDMLPRDRGDLGQQCGAGGVPVACCVSEEVGQDRGVRINEALTSPLREFS